MAFLFELAAGRQEQAAYNFNADVNERNADVSDQEAEQLVRNEEQNIADFREDFSDLQDATAQAYRYNGWIASTGTPLKVLLANAQEADEEIAARRYNAKVGKQELNEQGVQSRLAGTLDRMSGRAARTASKGRAITSLINTGTSAYSAFG